MRIVSTESQSGQRSGGASRRVSDMPALYVMPTLRRCSIAYRYVATGACSFWTHRVTTNAKGLHQAPSRHESSPQALYTVRGRVLELRVASRPRPHHDSHRPGTCPLPALLDSKRLAFRRKSAKDVRWVVQVQHDADTGFVGNAANHLRARDADQLLRGQRCKNRPIPYRVFTREIADLCSALNVHADRIRIVGALWLGDALRRRAVIATCTASPQSACITRADRTGVRGSL